MTDSELETMLEILPDYYKHLKENINSMLARIYGIFTVKMERIANVHILLMGNTIQYHNDDMI
jgi:1-phosphatidylinositol-4-phosphate 5-kinase